MRVEAGEADTATSVALAVHAGSLDYDGSCGAFMKLADVIRFGKNFKMDDAHRFAQHVVPEVVRPARIIWNQAIGAVFLLFTAAALTSGVTYYRQQNVVAFGFALFFGLVMGFFSVTSFLRARKIGRPRRI